VFNIYPAKGPYNVGDHGALPAGVRGGPVKKPSVCLATVARCAEWQPPREENDGPELVGRTIERNFAEDRDISNRAVRRIY